jgi:hypothetical protein
MLFEKPMMKASDTSEGMNYKQPGMYKEIRIGTQNVLTLNKGAALRNPAKVLEEYKVDITTLQEIRWVGEGILERWSSNISYITAAKKVNMNLAVDL